MSPLLLISWWKLHSTCPKFTLDMVEYIITLRIHQCTRPYDGTRLKVLNHSVIGQACETTISWSFRCLNILRFKLTILTLILTYLHFHGTIQNPFLCILYNPHVFFPLLKQFLIASSLRFIRTCSRFLCSNNVRRYSFNQGGTRYSTFYKDMMRKFHWFLQKGSTVRWLELATSPFQWPKSPLQ